MTFRLYEPFCVPSIAKKSFLALITHRLFLLNLSPTILGQSPIPLQAVLGKQVNTLHWLDKFLTEIPVSAKDGRWRVT